MRSPATPASLADLDDDEREAVEALTKAIVKKLLHGPSVRLRHDAGTPKGERNAAAVSDLFDLPEPVATSGAAIRLATRASPQARTQAQGVADALVAATGARPSSSSSTRPVTAARTSRCT